MTFRVTGHLKPQGTQRRVVQRITGPTEEMCLACEWFQPSVSRCTHPHHGCTSGAHRLTPWAHQRMCPMLRKLLRLGNRVAL